MNNDKMTNKETRVSDKVVAKFGKDLVLLATQAKVARARAVWLES
jgi:hypothetical protein